MSQTLLSLHMSLCVCVCMCVCVRVCMCVYVCGWGKCIVVASNCKVLSLSLTCMYQGLHFKPYIIERMTKHSGAGAAHALKLLRFLEGVYIDYFVQGVALFNVQCTQYLSPHHCFGHTYINTLGSPITVNTCMHVYSSYTHTVISHALLVHCGGTYVTIICSVRLRMYGGL